MGPYDGKSIDYKGKQLVIYGSGATLDGSRKGNFFDSLCPKSDPECQMPETSLKLFDLSLTSGMVSWEGGAFSVAPQANVEITRCTFIDNESAYASGGAIFVGISAKIVATECIFLRNIANGGGGAMFGAKFSLIVVVNSTFEENVCRFTGGAAINSRINSSIIVTLSTFRKNRNGVSYGGATGQKEGGGVVLKGNPEFNKNGGAINIFNASLSVNLSTFEQNTIISTYGGAISGTGGAIYADNGSYVHLHTVTFDGNKVPVAGGSIAVNYNTVVEIINAIWPRGVTKAHDDILRDNSSSITFGCPQSNPGAPVRMTLLCLDDSGPPAMVPPTALKCKPSPTASPTPPTASPSNSPSASPTSLRTKGGLHGADLFVLIISMCTLVTAAMLLYHHFFLSGTKNAFSDSSNRDPLLRKANGFGADTPPSIYQHLEIKLHEVDVQEPVGQGSYGQVFRAIWHGNDVALKVLDIPRLTRKTRRNNAQLDAESGHAGEREVEREDEAGALEDFEREVRILAEIKHPNIVR
jgi:hypothetical protein